MEKVKHQKSKKKRKERKEKTPQSEECLDDSLGVMWQGFFFFSRNESSVWREDHCRTRCRASLEHGFDSLQGGVSIAQIDVHLK